MHTSCPNFQELDQELADLEALQSKAGVPIVWVEWVHALCGMGTVAMGREENIANIFGIQTTKGNNVLIFLCQVQPWVQETFDKLLVALPTAEDKSLANLHSLQAQAPRLQCMFNPFSINILCLFSVN